MILLIDVGSGLMVLFYYVFISIILYFYRYFYYWLFFFLFSFLILIFFRQDLYNFISNYIPYIGEIFYNSENFFSKDVKDKYPIILRPIITYLSFIFLTPAKIKIIPLYIIFSFYLILFFFKTFKKISTNTKVNSKNKFYFQHTLFYCATYEINVFEFSKLFLTKL
jgi:hypothetical protein